MPKAVGFSGFPQEPMKFPGELRANSSRKWLEAHRSDYVEFCATPAKSFAETVGAGLSRIARATVAELRINGSIWRINRDVRLTKDKRPCKDHRGISFREGEKRENASSLSFFRINPEGFLINAGCQTCLQVLKPFRAAVADTTSGKILVTIAKKIGKSGLKPERQHYKRMPRAFSEGGPAAELLRDNALCVVDEQDTEGAHAKDVVCKCVKT